MLGAELEDEVIEVEPEDVVIESDWLSEALLEDDWLDDEAIEPDWLDEALLDDETVVVVDSVLD